MIFDVDKDYLDVRLDRFLRKNCKDNSLQEIFKAIRTGSVKVNDKKAKENYKLKIGDKISINGLSLKLKEKKICVIKDKSMVFYEDDDILIIDKPKGIAMHKGSKNEKGLSEMFNVTFSNRLDKKTSGLVIACKNPSSLRYMTGLIRENKVIKKYRAVCKYNGKYKIGDSFKIENHLLETYDKVVVSKEGKLSITKFKVIMIKDGKIYFDIELLTGRKHQIRVQLANIGLPIIGDSKYGSYKKEDELELDCYYLEFDGKIYEKK